MFNDTYNDFIQHTPNQSDQSEIIDLLNYNGINTKNIRFDKNNNIHIPITAKYNLPDIPNGYAFKGGTARWLLENNLGIDSYIAPRDYDIVRLGFVEPNDNLDDQIASRYMPDDYKNGYGVEIISDEKEYLSQHDFTINELYATNNEIITTPACIKDTINRVIRLTEYEQQYSKDKLLAKAVRFMAEYEHFVPESASFCDVLKERLEDDNIQAFHIALHLDRAWGRGKEYANKFIHILKQYNQLPEEVNTPEQAVDYLNDFIYDFEYRNMVSENNDYDPFYNLARYADIIDKIYDESDKADISQRKKLINHHKIDFKDIIEQRKPRNLGKSERANLREAKWADYILYNQSETGNSKKTKNRSNFTI